MEELRDLENRLRKLEDRMAKKDIEFAVINTAIIGVLVKMMWGV